MGQISSGAHVWFWIWTAGGREGHGRRYYDTQAGKHSLTHATVVGARRGLRWRGHGRRFLYIFPVNFGARHRGPRWPLVFDRGYRTAYVLTSSRVPSECAIFRCPRGRLCSRWPPGWSSGHRTGLYLRGHTSYSYFGCMPFSAWPPEQGIPVRRRLLG